MHRFQTVLSLITNPIRSHIPTILAVVIPHVERNRCVIFQDPTVQLSSSEIALDPKQKKQRIRTMLHAACEHLTETKTPAVDIFLYNIDFAIKSTNPIRLPRLCEAVFADFSSSSGLYNF